MGIFSAVGKILWNKREDGEGGVKKGKGKGGGGGGDWVEKGGKKPPLAFRPEVVVEKVNILFLFVVIISVIFYLDIYIRIDIRQ